MSESGHMRYAEFERGAWKSLPRIRRSIAGRQVVEDCVRVMTKLASPDKLAECDDEEKRAAYRVELAELVKLGYEPLSGRNAVDYGVFWVLILQTVVVALVQYLITWWLEHRHPKALVEQWQRELRG